MDKEIKYVLWSARATKDLERITKFYIELYGLSKAKRIATDIRQSTEILGSKELDTSKIGEIDEAFLHFKRGL